MSKKDCKELLVGGRCDRVVVVGRVVVGGRGLNWHVEVIGARYVLAGL